MAQLIRLKGSTVIESIVAMTIIILCATMAFSVLTKQNKIMNNTIRQQAELNILFVVAQAKNAGRLIDETYTFENIRLELNITNYKTYKNLRLLTCDAYTLQNEFICDYKELISIDIVEKTSDAILN